MALETHPPRWTYNQIKAVTEKFLKDFHPSMVIPIPIEEIVELRLGIELSTYIDLKKEIGIDGFINSEFDEIVIDDYVFNKYEERARFTIAHELGHKFLHSKIYNSLEIKTVGDYVAFQNSVPENDHKWLEIQAHIFAACVLVPTIKLKKEFNKIMGSKPAQIDYSMPYLFELPGSPDVILRRLQKESLIVEKI